MQLPKYKVGDIFYLKAHPEFRFQVVNVRPNIPPEGRHGYEMKPLFEGYPGEECREFERGLETFYNKE